MKQQRNKSNPLSTFLIIVIPLLVVGLAIWLVGADNLGTKLGNNINDSSINWDKLDGQKIELSGTGKIIVNKPGVYTVSGTLEDGWIEVDTVGAVKLILSDTSITNTSGPAIYVAEANTVIVETAEGTKNTLTDGAIYTGWDSDVRGTLFSHDDLVLQGSGTLAIEANFEDGIVGKDDLKINSGTYVINAKDEAIRGRDSIYIVDGTFEISAGGDALKANNSEEVGKGWIKIDGGYLSASAGDDGIHAESSLEINGGTIQIAKSYEGFEAARIMINGGDISVTASDDGLNAAGGNDSSSPNMGQYQQSSNTYAIYINGGRLYVNATGDGIDSNGALYLNGGIVIVDGPINSGNGALDSETGIIYNGGSVVAVGASGMAVAPGETSEKYSISVYFTSTYVAGTTITVTDVNGNTLLKHTSLKSFQHAALSSEAFEAGQTYTINIDGKEYTSVTLSSKTTQVGQGGGMMPPGGGMAPGNRR